MLRFGLNGKLEEMQEDVKSSSYVGRHIPGLQSQDVVRLQLLVDVFLGLKVPRVFHPKEGVGGNVVHAVCSVLQNERKIQVDRFSPPYSVGCAFKLVIESTVLKAESRFKADAHVPGQGVRSHEVHVESRLRHVGDASEVIRQAVGHGKIEIALVGRQHEPEVVRPRVKVGKVLSAISLAISNAACRKDQNPCQ